MSSRLIFEALSELARRLEASADSLKRLSREQYKTNTLAEQQHDQTRQALELAQQTLDELKAAQAAQVQAARLEVVEALFPVIDSVDAAIRSGAAQARALMGTSPEAARSLVAWLEGQSLLRERLLDLLAGEGIEPVAGKGAIFDAGQHVAVQVVKDPAQPAGQIMSVQQRGFRLGERVLRYAEVVVNRPEESS